MKECYKDIAGYEGLYQVSDQGRIKSLGRFKNSTYKRFYKEKLLKNKLGKNGYYKVHLYKIDKIKTFNIHRLVAQAFIPNPENKPQVNHKDGNKLNNNDWNLEWNTNTENVQHAYDNKLTIQKKGENSHLSKLTEKNVKKIKSLKGKLLQKEIATKFNVSQKTISAIFTGIIWKHLN